ncbi:hypothetical protein AB0H75_11415, partial [Nonomuraea sp. NPDC050783]
GREPSPSTVRGRMHWHAYLWAGNGQELKHEAGRRPASPGFTTSPLPPMRTGDWLIKPRSRIAETFEDVDKAGEWMAGAYAPHRPDRDVIPLQHRLAGAADLLPQPACDPSVPGSLEFTYRMT